MKHSRPAADAQIDISAEYCPMTFVRTRLALDALQPGQTLGVRLRGEESIRNVPASARQLGHTILAEDSLADGVVWVLIRKAHRA